MGPAGQNGSTGAIAPLLTRLLSFMQIQTGSANVQVSAHLTTQQAAADAKKHCFEESFVS